MDSDLERVQRALPEVVDSVIHVLSNWQEQMVKIMPPILLAMERFAHQFMTAIRAEYRKAGAPYGDTQAGILRWWEEECARRGAIAETLYERECQQMIEDSKAKVQGRDAVL